MRSLRHYPLAGIFVVLAALVMTGCNAEQIGNQARSSLSSFITGVVSNAINDVIHGNN